MKKILLLCLLFCLMVFSVFADDYTLHDVPTDYLGVYIPVDYEILLRKYKSHTKAVMEIDSTHYDVLVLFDDVCHSSVQFDDGYAVLPENYEKWIFESEGKEKFIIDENGYKYRRLSEVPSEGEVANYVLRTILEEYNDKNVKIEENRLKLRGQTYEFQLEVVMSENYGSIILWSRKNSKRYWIIAEEDGFKLVEAERNPNDKWVYEPTGKVIYSFKKSK